MSVFGIQSQRTPIGHQSSACVDETAPVFLLPALCDMMDWIKKFHKINVTSILGIQLQRKAFHKQHSLSLGTLSISMKQVVACRYLPCVTKRIKNHFNESLFESIFGIQLLCKAYHKGYSWVVAVSTKQVVACRYLPTGATIPSPYCCCLCCVHKANQEC